MNTQLQILKNNINISGLIFDELDLVLEPALQKVVDDTANPFLRDVCDCCVVVTTSPLGELHKNESPRSPVAFIELQDSLGSGS